MLKIEIKEFSPYHPLEGSDKTGALQLKYTSDSGDKIHYGILLDFESQNPLDPKNLKRRCQGIINDEISREYDANFQVQLHSDDSEIRNRLEGIIPELITLTRGRPRIYMKTELKVDIDINNQ